MPITRSAKKAQRASLRRRVFNIRRTTAIEKAIKAFKKKPSKEAYQLVQKALDKAAKTHAINAGTAARKKSRLSKLLSPR